MGEDGEKLFLQLSIYPLFTSPLLHSPGLVPAEDPSFGTQILKRATKLTKKQTGETIETIQQTLILPKKNSTNKKGFYLFFITEKRKAFTENN